MTSAHILLRKGRHTMSGQAYLITFCTHDRTPLFADPILAHGASAALADARLWQHAMLLAWVLMPDHWHGIVCAGDEPVSRTVQRLKCNVAARVNRERGRSARVWAPAFQDRGLRDEMAVLAAARYLVMNPVRAGLVGRPGDYSWWDAVWV